jgi:hypothetical protein
MWLPTAAGTLIAAGEIDKDTTILLVYRAGAWAT